MKKRLASILAAAVLSVSFAAAQLPASVSADGADTETSADTQSEMPSIRYFTEQFVTRLYNVTLGRDPDSDGLANWSDSLLNRKATGISVAYGFIFSSEFQNKNYSNEQYVELMYNAFLGRASDSAGKANWLEKMDAGMTREQLFKGFANSSEFFKLCNSYGITAGTYVSGMDYKKVAQVNLFVDRLYEEVLVRNCDQTGMNTWTNNLIKGTSTGAQVAYGFFFSDEYINKNKDEQDYVEDLYRAFLGRGSDPDGKSKWITKIYNSSRLIAFNGFVRSQEFISLCDSYGITAGDKIWVPSAAAMNDGFTDYCFSLVNMGNIGKTSIYYAFADEILPYTFAGETMAGFDCSGLQVYVYRHYFHKEIPHSEAQEYLGRVISESELRPGDILGDHYYGGHGGAVIYAGKSEDGRDLALTGGWGSCISLSYIDLSDYVLRHID